MRFLSLKRQDIKRRVWNQSVRTELKTLAKKAPENRESLLEAIAALDRAARKGIIHKNAAARKKSRLMRKLAAQKT
ncbi:MAG: 30S ribosomal protein S20 [Armatimonadetes bacterium]|nr:30S ribosomal protein S20 [Armatimonadota bacterium]